MPETLAKFHVNVIRFSFYSICSCKCSLNSVKTNLKEREFIPRLRFTIRSDVQDPFRRAPGHHFGRFGTDFAKLYGKTEKISEESTKNQLVNDCIDAPSCPPSHVNEVPDRQDPNASNIFPPKRIRQHRPIGTIRQLSAKKQLVNNCIYAPSSHLPAH